MNNEKVLVVKRSDFENIPLPGLGFLTGKEKEIIEIIKTKGFFMNRREAEENSDFKQIIPYCLIRNKNYYFVTKRLKGGNEKRLHNQLSLGIGGHINPDKYDDEIINDYTINLSIGKELNEELFIDSNYTISECLGIINDDTNAVSSVHLGLLYKINVDHLSNVLVKEIDKLRGWYEPTEYLYMFSKFFESWSNIVFTYHINKDLVL